MLFRCSKPAGKTACAGHSSFTVNTAVGRKLARGRKRVPNVLRMDPTRTAALRRQIETEIKVRFKRLKGKVLKLIVDEDAFGLKPRKDGFSLNAFCPTGAGGGVDPSCSPGEGSGGVSFTSSDQAVAHFKGYKVKLSKGKLTDAEFKDAAEHISNEIESMSSMKVVSTMLSKRSREQSLELGREFLGSERGTSGKYKYGTGIELSKDLKVDTSATPVFGQHTVFTDLGGQFRHEFGHDVYNIGLTRGKQTDWNKRFEKYVGTNTVSRYGGTNTSELFSESFSAYSSKNYKRGSLPGDIEKWLDTNVRGIKTANEEFTANVGRWEFLSDPDKIKAFREWLRSQIKVDILSDEDLWRRYAEMGWKKGAARAFDDVKSPAKSLLSIGDEGFQAFQGTKDEFLRSAFNKPVPANRIKLLASRSYHDLEGITEQMSTVMTRTLTDGLSQGANPREIARDLVDEVDGLGMARATTMARTEIIRAHAEGQLDSMTELGVTEVGVQVEWNTAGDDAVCPQCEPLEGVVLNIDEARGMLPRHPNCRCAWIPANVGEDDSTQKNTKKQIESAVRVSVRAGGEKDIEEGGWGPATDISKTRPTRNEEDPIVALDEFLQRGV